MAKKETKPNFIVSFFLNLANSKKYTQFKHEVRELLQNPLNRYKRYIDYILIFLVITSVAVFIYEVGHDVPAWLEFYAVYFTSAIFAIEYLFNFWIYNDIHKEIEKEYNDANLIGRKGRYAKVLFGAIFKKISYIFTPMAIIDLLAIISAYRTLRVLKIFVLFRFLKLLKHARSIHNFIEVLADRKFELVTLLILLVFVVFVGGLSIYIAEGHKNAQINNLFDALYWSFITITTVGYGDISPISTSGKIIAFIIIVLGIVMISFATSVLVSAFSEKLNELKEERIAEHISENDSFLIICGYGQIARIFLQQYQAISDRYIILDVDKERVAQAINDGHNAIHDDPSRYVVLKRFYNENSKITVLALTGSDIENIYISLNAKTISKDIEVIARASSHKLYEKYIRAGADRVILPNEIASSMMVASIVHPTMYKAINAILNYKDVANISEIYISENCKIIGKNLEEVNFKSYKIVIFGVQNGINGEFKFAPKKDYILKENDILVVLGHKMSINYFKSINNIGRYR